MADFRRFLQLARALRSLWHGGGMVPTPNLGRLQMTYANDKLQQIALSVIGAVLASSLFISAAIGPVTLV
jgi:hypothetical protein